ncbi:MAG: fused MFS/spermidine synthase [Clostridiales bacterium]|nr:fused MFS/spermidine synthase [Clostridiales bacterium]
MENRLLKNKGYLYLTEFFSGVSVMAVELGASRLLAPYFSSSQIVWTIIIGTIMIAMALGNIWGGRAADKDPDPGKLYMRLIIAAVWIGLIPLVGKYIIIGVSGLLVLAVNTNYLIIAAFVSCMVIFVFPLFLLGTVTPSLVKYTMSSMEDSGSTVGKLEAFNTVGSIIGTFLPTFVTIPAVGTSITFLIFSAVLLILGLVYFIITKTKRTACIVSAVVFAVSVTFGHSDSFAFWETDLLYEGESIYNYLQVSENSRSVALSTNVLFGVQSVAMKDGGLTGMYYDYALAAPYMSGADEPEILVLGMGSGTFSTLCSKYIPSSSIKGVEIDEKITDLAHAYFGLPDTVEVATYDGRAYLAADKGKYDVIMVDAYQDITIPFQMSSVEFFTLVKEHLKDNGVMVVNLNMVSDGEGSINAHLCDTIASVFDYVKLADVRGSTNRELFAFVNEPREFSGVGVSGDIRLETCMVTVAESLYDYQSGGLLLTDDKAPVELLGIQVIDELISGELSYYKRVFEERGLGGLIADLTGTG